MSTFVLKIIAVISMLVDHTVYIFPEYFPYELRGIIGRLAFPLYAYLIAVGIEHTKSPMRYLIRLFIFAVISEPFFDLALKGGSISYLRDTNIFFTLFLGASAIYVYKIIFDKLKESPKGKYFIWLGIIPIPVFVYTANLITTDYAWYGVMFIISFYFIRKLSNAYIKYFSIFTVTLAQYFVFIPVRLWLPQTQYQLSLIAGFLIASVLLCLYNEKLGFNKIKWFFYAFYPGHLLILFLIKTHITTA